MSDQRLAISNEAIAALGSFLAEPKFVEADFYPEPSQEVRESAELLVNNLVVRLINTVKANPSKGYVLSQLKDTLDAFSSFDSEEQDHLMAYLGRLLDIFGIATTDGLIGDWRYGALDISANDP